MDVTLRDYVEQWEHTHDQRHTAHQHEHEREHQQTADAVRTAREATDRRFDTLVATIDRVQTASTDRTDEHYKLNVARIEALEQAGANLQGRFWALGVGLTILTIVLNVALPLLGVK